ncbi:glycosyltransferase family 4 protein [Salegentibacter agarivorans]
MKVLHVSGARRWGGNEQQLLFIIKELSVYGVEQELFCFKESPLIEATQSLKVKLIIKEYSKPHTFKYLSTFKNIIKNNAYDLIHLHTSNAVTGFVFSDLLYNLNIPCIYMRQGIRKKISYLSKLKYNYSKFDAIVCVSENVKNSFQRILSEKNKEKLIVIHNGVELKKAEETSIKLREKYGISQDTFLIGSIANHTQAKDLTILIEVLNILVNRYDVKNIHLVQIGEFYGRTSALKELVEKYKLKNKITFTDFLPEAFNLMPQFDCLLVTSEREGGPTAVLEAFNYKVPVVSTKVGLVEETIKDGINGFVANVKDAPALVEKVKTLIEKPYLQEDFTDKAYYIFKKNFTTKVLGRKTFELYKSLVEQKKQ